jgi:hypothetical protein
VIGLGEGERVKAWDWDWDWVGLERDNGGVDKVMNVKEV